MVEAEEDEESYFASCWTCFFTCRTACCKHRVSRNWHMAAQKLLSKAIINIVMFLRLKVKLENESKPQDNAENEPEQAAGKQAAGNNNSQQQLAIASSNRN